jgi:SSS family solute:Na+ symporter
MNGLDMTVMFVYFGVLIVAGIIGSLKAKSSEEFILAGRNLGMFMYLGCLSAVILGGASTIGTAQLGYEHGLSGIWFVTMIGLGIITLGTIFIKRISSLKVTTISELLGKRYNAQAQIISAVVAAIYTLMVSVTQVIGMGTIIHALLGWNMTTSMLMWSVTVTDIIQFVVMTVAIFGFMLPISVSEAGGLKALAGDLPTSYFDFSSIGYGQIFQYFLLYTLGMAVSQDIWQRVFTARTEKIARNGSIFAGVYSIAYAIAGSVIGMCAYLLLPSAESSQSIFATLAVQILPQGLLGLVLAGVCSALMSTASGTLLASSTLISNDIIKKVWLKNISEKNYLILTRVNTLIVGVLAIVFALWIQDVLVALDVAYAILSGAIFVPFVVSLFWKDIHPKAGVSAIVVSTLVVLGGLLIEGLSSTTPILYGISSSIIVMAGFAVMARNKELSDREPVSEDVK